MYNQSNWRSSYLNNIWMESTETWNDRHNDWKAVGTDPYSKMKCLVSFPNQERYYVIEFASGRMDVGYAPNIWESDTYVIVEADRGEDCGKIVGETTKEKYDLITKQLQECTAMKRILRTATLGDLEILNNLELVQRCAMIHCIDLVKHKNIPMEVVRCEYQWDMKKITFYFKSERRIDFRDLLKDLFKLFKIRIWMCADVKPTNSHFREILNGNVWHVKEF